MLQGLAFNLINIENSRIYKDTNQIKVIKQLRKDIAILKPENAFIWFIIYFIFI